jgi:hypothetical protein
MSRRRLLGTRVRQGADLVSVMVAGGTCGLYAVRFAKRENAVSAGQDPLRTGAHGHQVSW